MAIYQTILREDSLSKRVSMWNTPLHPLCATLPCSSLFLSHSHHRNSLLFLLPLWNSQDAREGVNDPDGDFQGSADWNHRRDSSRLNSNCWGDRKKGKKKRDGGREGREREGKPVSRAGIRTCATHFRFALRILERMYVEVYYYTLEIWMLQRDRLWVNWKGVPYNRNSVSIYFIYYNIQNTCMPCICHLFKNTYVSRSVRSKAFLNSYIPQIIFCWSATAASLRHDHFREINQAWVFEASAKRAHRSLYFEVDVPENAKKFTLEFFHDWRIFWPFARQNSTRNDFRGVASSAKIIESAGVRPYSLSCRYKMF